MKRNILFAILLISFFVSASSADDFNPPSWRGGPLSVEAEWEFDTPPGNWFFIPPDFFGTVSGPGTEPLYNVFGTHAEVDSVTNWTWINGPFGQGLQTTQNNAGITFALQNWVDEMPWKDVRIQINAYGNSSVLDPYFNNFQNLFYVAGQKEYDLGTDLDDVDVTWDVLDYGIERFPGNQDNDIIQAWADLRLWPNPDWEKIGLTQMPAGIVIDQVYIDTISIPEPMTLALLAIGSLAALRRKKA